MLDDLETLQGELAADTRIQRIGSERARKVTTADEQISRMATKSAVVANEGARDKVTGAVLPLARLKRPRLIAAVGIIILAAAAAYFY